MTVFLISVGVSLMATLANAKESSLVDDEWAARLDAHPPSALWDNEAVTDAMAADRWMTGALTSRESPAHARVAAGRLAAFVAQVRPDLWPARWGAELNTMHHHPPGGRLGSRDTAVLIVSDTAHGLLAGLWNAIALAGGDLGRVRYLSDPSEASSSPGHELAPGTVLVSRVPGMDIGTTDGFNQAMRGMGYLANRLLRRTHRSGPETFVAHLSGGYKATIPYLIGLAEWIRSAGWDGDVEAYVLHETTDALIKLPLRQIPYEVVQDELGTGWDPSGARAARPGAADRPMQLNGYAYSWQAADRRWQLTPFGVGLRAVFGFEQLGLGG